MSEVTPPEANQPIEPNAPAWYAQWENFSPTVLNQQVDQMDEPEDAPLVEDDWQDWQTVDFPNAISVDAIAQEGAASQPLPPDWAVKAIPTPAVAAPAQPASLPLSDQPPLEELVSLIQELNQCNSALIDRVSQLEEALEQSHRQLLAAKEQLPQPRMDDLQDLPESEQIVHLLNQLELSQQTNHHQQTLIDTLRHQLTGAQEQAAQLERECAALQDQHSQQSQKLLQSEHTCRDLHNRLQRQQRYTLQYKAALEKYLDVPPPDYDPTDVISPLAAQSWQDSPNPLQPQPFLPKIQRIQPWSAQTQSLAGKLEAFINIQEEVESAVAEAGAEAIASPEAAPTPTTMTEFPTQLTSPATGNTPEGDELPPVNLLAEDDAEAALSQLSPEVIQVGLTELRSVLGNLWTEQLLPASLANAGAEEDTTLWQNLARLIDVSTDDVLKASNSGDFTDFEAIAPAAAPVESAQPIEPAPEVNPLPPSPPKRSERKLHLPVAPSTDRTASAVAPSPVVNPGIPSSVDMAVASSAPPSPLLYPTGSLKKRGSLASVELPTFPR